MRIRTVMKSSLVGILAKPILLLDLLLHERLLILLVSVLGSSLVLGGSLALALLRLLGRRFTAVSGRSLALLSGRGSAARAIGGAGGAGIGFAVFQDFGEM